MLKSVLIVSLLGGVLSQMQQQLLQGQQTKDASAQAEPAAAASNAYGSRYGGVDPRYYDRGDTPHFGLAGFPFGYERRYYGQNVVYDNSLAGFPLNYHNYQDYGYNNYNGNSYASKGYAKPQYRSGSYASPRNYVQANAYPAVEYGAYLSKPEYNSNNNNNGYYSLQYGY